jgi:hypothetical protein
VAGACELGNELSGSVKWENYSQDKRLAVFQEECSSMESVCDLQVS